MSLKSKTEINVDFCDKKHILINAKQLDKYSRVLYVTCYNHGELCHIDKDAHSACIRYRKADDYGVFNECDIINGKIIVNLTEQMLAADGICYADLVIIDKGMAEVDADTGEITAINSTSILSTMTFCINVLEVPVDNSEVESNYDFDALNESLDALNAEYTNVILMSKSWAVGGTGIRNDESENNAQYWAQVAAQNAVGIPSVVTSIKGSNEANYRNGQVVITADNVGAIPSANIATVNEVKNYLGI